MCRIFPINFEVSSWLQRSPSLFQGSACCDMLVLDMSGFGYCCDVLVLDIDMLVSGKVQVPMQSSCGIGDARQPSVSSFSPSFFSSR